MCLQGKVLMFETYKAPSGDSQGTNTKIYGLMIRLCFISDVPCIAYLFLFFYTKNNYSNVLNGDVHETSTGLSCGASREPNNETF